LWSQVAFYWKFSSYEKKKKDTHRKKKKRGAKSFQGGGGTNQAWSQGKKSLDTFKGGLNCRENNTGFVEGEYQNAGT